MLSRRLLVTTGVSICLALAGCGKGKGDNEAVANESGNTEVAAADTPPELNCPSRFDIPPAPAGAPQDSVAGLRLGTPLDQATLYIQCQNKPTRYDVSSQGGGFTIQSGDENIRQMTEVSYSRPMTPDEKRQYDRENIDELGQVRNRASYDAQAKHLSDEFTLFALGRKGSERLEGIWRSQFYDQGRMPPAADVGRELVTKYGPPSQVTESSSGATMIWMYDTYGRKMTEQTPGFGNCSSSVGTTDGHMSATPECGLMITAAVTKFEKNELLAKSLAVGVANPSKVAADIDTLNRQFKTEDDARKLRELNNAGANKPAVKL